MDIAYYLSELLGELGEVNVPDLGSFTQQKIDGYYNSTEGKFYPPTAEVYYSQSFFNDDILAEYIAEKKKISIASSKYFIEKYSSKIKVDVMMEDVQLAGLGWIYPKGDGLAFRKSPEPVIDPAYYGYPQIELQQISKPVVADPIEAITEATKEEIAAPPVLQETTVAEPEVLGTIHEETELPPVLQHEPISEPEAVSIEHEAPPVQHVVEETPVADPVNLIIPEEEPTPHPSKIKEEPVIAPLDFGASMEGYLRELEGGTHIAGPEAVEQPAYTEPVMPEPVTELPEHEIAPEQIIELPEAVSVPEPVIEVPKVEPVPESVTDIPFPEHIPSSYTPDAELQRYILDETPVKSQSDAYTPPPVKSSHEEEEFVFDGKGYDDVDTRHNYKKSYLWLWITLGIIVLLAGAGAYAYYKHDQKIKREMAAAAASKPVIKKDTSKNVAPADSLKDSLKTAKDSTKNGVIVDTTDEAAQPVTAAPAIDSSKVRYELIGINAKNIADADHRVANYKSLGVTDAHIVTGPVEGKQLKISLGTYANKNDAINRRHAIIKAGKIRNIEIIKFNPKK